MPETRKLAAILCSDVVGFSRLAGADEDRILAQLRALRSDLIDPMIAVHNGRIVKRSGDGALVEFRSAVAAVRFAIEVQNAMAERNAGVPEDRQIVFRIGIHIGDVVEESDGDLMGDGVNIAARLEGIAKPGAICLSEQAYWQVKRRLELAVTDLGPTQLKNIAEPIRVYSIDVGQPARAKPTLTAAHEKSAAPRRFSIVILPFTNIGGDPEQEDFVDGVTESLTTDLSRIRNAFVIARSTAFTFKRKAIDVRSLGRELNVRYVLEGSVRRRGARMRVNVQLVDAESGSHVWAERFDKPVADFFEMQDEIVARIGNQLGTELVQAEARRAQPPTPDAIDLTFRGMASFVKGLTGENMSKARAFFERALAIDPDNVTALVGIAFVDFLVAAYLYPEDRAARVASAEAAALKALSLAPDYAPAHFALGTVLGVTKGPELGIAECERALAINPNLASAHATIGIFKVYVGHPEETEPCVSEALRLSPRDSFAFTWRMFVGISKMHLGRNDEALVWLRRSIEDNRNNPMSHFLLAATLALLGRTDEARAVAKGGLELNPKFTIARYRDGPWRPPSAAHSALKAQIIDALRLSGVPEG